jgi:serine/threonine protein kinase
MMFYEILYGYMPFSGNSPDELYQTIMSNKLKFPLNVKISNSSKNFLNRALAVQEKDRISW